MTTLIESEVAGGISFALTDEQKALRALAREFAEKEIRPRAVRAGADLLLFTSPAYAERAIRALIPLARRGELDEHVVRVLRFRRRFGS